ncbi:MAG: hypothetical protein ACRD0G_17830 [Acidimicrobiales bacterium]
MTRMPDSETPEPDAQEQAAEVVDEPSTPPRPATDDAEAPEADALEQGAEVPVDDGYDA